MTLPSIQTAAEAIAFLNALGSEVISTLGGFIVREAGYEGDGYEITCDSVGELIEHARSERDIMIRMGQDTGPQQGTCEERCEERMLDRDGSGGVARREGNTRR